MTRWPAWRAISSSSCAATPSSTVVEERLKGRIEGVVADVNKELSLDGYTLAASVGVAWSSGSDVTADELLTEARASLLRAKAQR